MHQSGRHFKSQIEALMVYFRLRIVSITLRSKVPDVLVVLDAVGGGGGSSDLPVVGMLPTTPVVGMLPAKSGVESTHMSTTAKADFFMVCLAPLDVKKDAEILT